MNPGSVAHFTEMMKEPTAGGVAQSIRHLNSTAFRPVEPWTTAPLAGDRSVIWAGVVCAIPAPPGSAPGSGDRGDGEERDHAGGTTHPT